MSPLKPSRVFKEKLVRIGADTVMVNLSFLLAFALRFFYMIAFEDPHGDINHTEKFWNYIVDYINSAWLLTLICLTTFVLNGFYSTGRAYRGRYKALIVAQAASLSFLLFGFFSYFLGSEYTISRTVLVVAWLLSVGHLVAARLWSLFWAKLTHSDQKNTPAPHPDKTSSNKILVIGGAGYIGSALLPKLLEQGYEVRLLDLLLYSMDPIQELLGHPRLEVMEADFRQVDKVVEAMRDVQAVVHLGGIVGDPACDLDEELTMEVNVMATRVIAEIAKGFGVERFIFASTCSVYGANDEWLDECSQLNPVSLYAKSKIASEKMLTSMADRDFSPIILRFATIFGLSGRPRFDLVVNLLTAKAVLDGEITVFSGDQHRPFLFVGDAAESLYRVFEAPLETVRNQIFNIGSDAQNYTVDEVAELIQRQVPTARILDMGTDADRRNYRVNFSKMRRALNYEPEVSVAQGIAQVVEAIQLGSITDYTDVKYSNVKFLSEDTTSDLIQRQFGWTRALINEPIGPTSSDPT